MKHMSVSATENINVQDVVDYIFYVSSDRPRSISLTTSARKPTRHVQDALDQITYRFVGGHHGHACKKYEFMSHISFAVGQLNARSSVRASTVRCSQPP